MEHSIYSAAVVSDDEFLPMCVNITKVCNYVKNVIYLN